MFYKNINPYKETKVFRNYLAGHFTVISASVCLMFLSKNILNAAIIPFICALLLLPFPYVHALKSIYNICFDRGTVIIEKADFKNFVIKNKIAFIKHNKIYKDKLYLKTKKLNESEDLYVKSDNLPKLAADLYQNSTLSLNLSCLNSSYFTYEKNVTDNLTGLKYKDSVLSENSIDSNLVYIGRGFNWSSTYLKLSIKLLADTPSSDNGLNHGLKDIHNLCVDNKKPLCFSADDLSTHTLIFGTTGSGKTRFYDLLCSQAIYRGECVIVLDPKGDKDLRNTLKRACDISHRERDFLELDYMHEKLSIALNPLSASAEDAAIAQRIASLLGGSGSAENFKSAAYQALCAVIASLRLTGKAITIDNIRKLIVNHDSYAQSLYSFIKETVQKLDKTDINEFFRRLSGMPRTKTCSCNIAPDNLEKIYSYMVNKGYIQHDPAFFTIKSMTLYDRSYYLKMTSVVHPVLNALCSSALYSILSSERAMHLSMQKIIDKKKVLYIPLYCLSNATLGSYLGKLMLSELSHCAGSIYASSSKKGRVNVFVDEASEIADEPLVQLLNKARGADFAITVATQSFDDLIKRVGSQSGANQIIANCNSIISLRVLDSNTASVICSRMPETTVQKVSTSNSYSLSNNSSISTGTTRSVSNTQSSIINPQLLMNLPDLEFFAKLSGSQIVKGILPLAI